MINEEQRKGLSFFLSFFLKWKLFSHKFKRKLECSKAKMVQNGRSKSQFIASRGRNTFMWPVKWMLFRKGPVFPQLICREIAQSKLHCCVRERKSNKKQKVIYLNIYIWYIPERDKCCCFECVNIIGWQYIWSKPVYVINITHSLSHTHTCIQTLWCIRLWMRPFCQSCALSACFNSLWGFHSKWRF